VTSSVGVQSASVLLRWQFQLTHGLLEVSMDALTPEAAAYHAQAVLREDLTINGVLAAQTPLALSTWRGRTGLSELSVLAAPIDWSMWIQRVRLDPGEFRCYTQAVYAATDAFLALEHHESTVCLLSALLLTVSMRRGQIACLQARSR